MRRGKNQKHKNRVINVLKQKGFTAEVRGSQLELAETKAPIIKAKCLHGRDTCRNIHISNTALMLNLL